MTTTPIVTVRELVAANVRRLRGATTSTPDDIVRAARRHGLDWTAAWVQGVERGQKALSAEHLLMLPLVLSTALAHRVSLADLLLGDDSVRFGDAEAEPVRAELLREMITAPPYRRPFTAVVGREPEADRPPSPAQAAAEKLRLISRANLGDVDVRALARAEAGAGDAEVKLARKLGVPEIVVIAASAMLWGRSMTEEREDQLQPGAGGPAPSAAALTRKLTGAVAARIAEAEAEAAAQVAPAETEPVTEA